MNATGIGYAGIDGAWWRPATEPFVLPAQVERQLQQIGHAIFLFFDTMMRLYGTDEGAACGLNRLLASKVPPHIPRLVGAGRVEAVRPDFQLCLRDDGAYQLVATELEICPSAQGFAHAMQVGYGLPTDLVEMFARYLNGCPLLFVGTEQWSEFLFEQLAFCRALAGAGAQGYVLYDRPLQTLADEVQKGQRWRLPIFGVEHRPPSWDADVIGRIERHGLKPYLWPNDLTWPESVGDAVVFRFGYFDCFAPQQLQRLIDWQAAGATFLNPTTFFFDSKSVLATLGLPNIRQAIAATDAAALAILDRALPSTLLLEDTHLELLIAEQQDWVVKFAGFDRDNQAWGGRSLQIGAQHTAETWRRTLEQYLALPWPTVAQRVAPSQRVDLAYFDHQDEVHWLRQGHTRLRTFFLRNPGPEGNVLVGGSHLTVAAAGGAVAESRSAVQAPVSFQDSLTYVRP